MQLKEIANISGMPGLFRVFKSTPRTLIMETLDDKKEKTAIGSSHRVSILQEISIYTNDKEGSIALSKVLQMLHEKYNGQLPVEPKTDGKKLLEFLGEVLENFDRIRVYASDVKKLVSWYNILFKYAPETLVPQEVEGSEEKVKGSGE